MTQRDARVVTVQRHIPAPPERIFDMLRRPARHHELDGSGMLRGTPNGPELLRLGDRFSMAMTQARLPYRSVNHVVEYEQGRLITWETSGRWRGRVVVGGQRWRYELTPDGDGTLVHHSYLWGHARWALLTIALPGYPRRMRATMPKTLVRLEHAVT